MPMEYDDANAMAYMPQAYNVFEGADFLNYAGDTGLTYPDSLDGCDSSPQVAYDPMPMPEYFSSGSSYATASPVRTYTPLLQQSTPPPALYTVAGASSPESSSSLLIRSHGSPEFPPTMPRSQRYNPMAVPASRQKVATPRRKVALAKREESDAEDDVISDDEAPRKGAPRGSAVRKQRIESEQRRRDELREGFARLKQTLPPSNQKSSKVSLLDRSTTHIRLLEASSSTLQSQLDKAQADIAHLRKVNEALMLNSARVRGPGAYAN